MAPPWPGMQQTIIGTHLQGGDLAERSLQGQPQFCGSKDWVMPCASVLGISMSPGKAMQLRFDAQSDGEHPLLVNDVREVQNSMVFAARSGGYSHSS